MVIRCKDTEADTDADAETQMDIDFEAGGSSTDACWHQLGSSWEAEFLLGSPKAEQASRVQLRVTFSLNLFILACTSVHFWHYRPRFSLRNITLNTHCLLITDITGRIQAMCETVWKVLFLLYIILSSQS